MPSSSSQPQPELVDRTEFCALVELWKERFRVDRREAFSAVSRRLHGRLERPFPTLGSFEKWIQDEGYAREISSRKLEIRLEQHFRISSGPIEQEGDPPAEPLPLDEDRLSETDEVELRQLSKRETKAFMKRNRAAIADIGKRILTDPDLRRKVCAGYLRYLAIVSRRR